MGKRKAKKLEPKIKPHPLHGPYTRDLGDGRFAFISEMTYGKARINITSATCQLAIDIGF